MLNIRINPIYYYLLKEGMQLTLFVVSEGAKEQRTVERALLSERKEVLIYEKLRQSCIAI